MRDRLLLLPGTSNPRSPRYRQVFEDIINLAAEQRFTSLVASYPGHGRGTLTFKAALMKTRLQWKRYQPTWVIARSFGCAVAAALLADSSLAANIKGAVFWGPTLSNWVRRFLPTQAQRKKEIASYRKYDANLFRTFLDDFPMLEVMIENAASHIRLVRGTRDKYNPLEDLNFLAAIHRRGQPLKISEVVEIPGLEHTIVPSKLRC